MTDIALTIFIFASVIATGVALSKIRIAGISLGTTWILFAGIAASHFGLTVDTDILNFARDFGLVLFVFALGLQIGPGFFSALRSGGVKQIGLAMIVIILGAAVTYLIYMITGTPLQTMVGVMDGAAVNTPAMGATQQAYFDITNCTDDTIAMSFATAYPIGIVAVIIAFIVLKALLRIDINKENEELSALNSDHKFAAKYSVEVTNKQFDSKSVSHIRHLIGRQFVISLISHGDNKAEIADSESIVHCGDKLFIVSTLEDKEAILAFLGTEIDMLENEWGEFEGKLASRRIIVTRSEINGKRFSDLRLRTKYGINITRVVRAGVDLIPYQGMELQIGDKVVVVGTESAIDKVAELLGNSSKSLSKPHIFTIFLGIALGVAVGSIPLIESPQIRLGLAAGPMLMAILMGRFGTRLHLVTYTTMGANLMLREVGLALFLASVGLLSGNGFIEALQNGGYIWMLYALIIAIVPLIIAGIFARKVLKMNFFTLMGTLSGSMTNPIALTYAGNVAGSDMPAISYATVYPLVMFLRVVVAQLIIAFCL